MFHDIAKMFFRLGARLEPPEDSHFRHKPITPAKELSKHVEFYRASRFELVQKGLEQETQKLREAEAKKIETAHKLEASKATDLGIIFAHGSPHGTGARQLQMSVDTGVDEFYFLVSSLLLRVP